MGGQGWIPGAAGGGGWYTPSQPLLSPLEGEHARTPGSTDRHTHSAFMASPPPLDNSRITKFGGPKGSGEGVGDTLK